MKTQNQTKNETKTTRRKNAIIIKTFDVLFGGYAYIVKQRGNRALYYFRKAGNKTWRLGASEPISEFKKLQEQYDVSPSTVEMRIRVLTGEVEPSVDKYWQELQAEAEREMARSFFQS